MKKIKKGNESIIKTISINVLSENDYRLSDFSYIYSENNIHILTSILTGETYLLSINEFNKINEIKYTNVDKQFIIDNGFEILVFSRLIVETDYNDRLKYQTILQLLKIMSGKKKGINAYTILPTTGCNARCIYCFQDDFKVKNMNIETADKVVDYIAKTKSEGVIKIAWFGGEPLVGKKIITHICSKLNSRNIQFKSFMISNGALFDEETIDEAVELWNLKKVQISVDGEKNDYEYRKKYVNPQKDNYERVMNNVKALAHKGINVTIRSNYDKNNIEGIKILIDDLSDRFIGIDNISIYFHSLFQEYVSDDFVYLMQKSNDLYKYAQSKGMKLSVRASKGLKLNYCLADSETSVSIFPDGVLYNCRDCKPELTQWGNIFDGITDQKRYEELKAEKPVEKECEHCCFLPICTSFYKKGCPNSHKYCYEERKAELERGLHEIISDLKEKGEL